MELITINKLELASELAENRLICQYGYDLYEEGRPENFTDYFQDRFNEQYEYYLDIIDGLIETKDN